MTPVCLDPPGRRDRSGSRRAPRRPRSREETRETKDPQDPPVTQDSPDPPAPLVDRRERRENPESQAKEANQGKMVIPVLQVSLGSKENQVFQVHRDETEKEVLKATEDTQAPQEW